jgi:outer membrane protein assembly factor BamB
MLLLQVGFRRLGSMTALFLAGSTGYAVAESAAGAGWPMFAGPTGNFDSARSEAAIIDTLAQARRLWESEEQNLGVGKCCYGFEKMTAAGDYPLPGGVAGPIAAEGLVFVSVFRPSGDIYTDDALRTLKKSPAVPKENWAIEADDVLVAIEAETGKTRWRVVQARKGVSHMSIKRGGWGVSPAYWQGRIYQVGTTARLYCYEAATGKLYWESSLGKAHEMAEAAKAEALKSKHFFKMGNQWLTSLVVADDVLAIRNFGDGGLVGLNANTGKIVWTAPKCLAQFSTPSLARIGGRAHLLANDGLGTVRLIGMADGKVLWEKGGFGPYLTTMPCSDTHVLLNVKPYGKGGGGEVGEPADDKDGDEKGKGGKGKGKDEEGGKGGGVWGCLRFDRNGAELAWKLPDEPKYALEWGLDNGPRRKAVVHNGVAYIAYRGAEKRGGLALMAVRVADGKRMAELSPQAGSLEGDEFCLPTVIEDKLLCFYDMAHNGRDFGASLFALGKDGVPARLSHDWRPELPGGLACGYEVLMEAASAGGRIHFRTGSGSVVCFDLRKP